MSRKRVGQPISITLTDEQRDWIDAQIPPGSTRTEVVRRIIQAAMEAAHSRTVTLTAPPHPPPTSR